MQVVSSIDGISGNGSDSTGGGYSVSDCNRRFGIGCVHGCTHPRRRGVNDAFAGGEAVGQILSDREGEAEVGVWPLGTNKREEGAEDAEEADTLGMDVHAKGSRRDGVASPIKDDMIMKFCTKKDRQDMRILVAIQELEDEAEAMDPDTDVGDDVFNLIRETPPPWSMGRIFRLAMRQFRNVDRITLRATIVAILYTMRKTAQHILMSSIRHGNTRDADHASTIHLDLDVVDMYSGNIG